MYVEETMRAIELDAHMRQVGTWVNWHQTVDTFKIGNPQIEVRGIAVSWMSSLSALREAVQHGCNLFVTHEPTFYANQEDDPKGEEDRNTQEKLKLLQESGMVVYRCHDVWDLIPEVGVRDSWISGLGYAGYPLIRSQMPFFNVVDIGETTLGELAEYIAAQIAPLGQPGVQMVGDGRQIVRRVGLGTGYTGGLDVFRMLYQLGADVCIATEVSYWREVRWAMDLEWGILICEHAVSELWGIESLARYISDLFPTLPVTYIPTKCAYQVVMPPGIER